MTIRHWHLTFRTSVIDKATGVVKLEVSQLTSSQGTVCSVDENRLPQSSIRALGRAFGARAHEGFRRGCNQMLDALGP